MLQRVWEWLRDKENRGALQLIGGGIVTTTVAVWTVFLYFENQGEVDQISSNLNSLIVIVDSHDRRDVIENLELELSSLKDTFVDAEPVSGDWIRRAEIIASKSPDIVIAHFHLLRNIDGMQHLESEEELLLGLQRILSIDPEVTLVIYSSGFDGHNTATNKYLLELALERLKQKNPQLKNINELVNNAQTVSWSNPPSNIERQGIYDLMVQLLKKN